MFSVPLIVRVALTIVVLLLIHGRVRRYRHLKTFALRQGCKPPKHLPYSWYLPFGLDKFKNFVEAERACRLPVLCLSEHEFHGETYAQNAGGAYIIFTRDPANLRTILSTKFKDFELGNVRRGIFSPLLGQGIFTNDGLDWQRSRKLLAPTFHQPNTPNFDSLEKHTQVLLSGIQNLGRKGTAAQSDTEVDIHPLFLELTMSTAMETLIGPSGLTAFTTGQAGSAQWLDPLNYSLKYLARRERLREFYWLRNSLQFRRACRETHAIFDRVIGDRVRHKGASTTLDHILDTVDDTVVARNELLNLLFAARDTTAAFLDWIFYSLGREPGVRQRVQQEIANVLQGDTSRAPTPHDLAQMTYLDDVMNEVLRLFPVVPLNGRLCVRDTTLPRGGGSDGESPILVPKGTWVSYSVFALQLSSRIHGPDAAAFRPERWRDASAKDRTTSWTWAPFNGGPRKCLGERYALRQAKYVTVRLLQAIDAFEAVDTGVRRPGKRNAWYHEVNYHVDFIMSPHGGNWLKVHNMESSRSHAKECSKTQ